MRLIACDDARAVAIAAADRIETLLRQQPAAVLGLATGRTMEPLYGELRQRHQRGLSFAGCTTFNLDEYAELPPGDRRSFRYFMAEQLFGAVDLRPEHTHLPNPDGDGRAYERAIAAAGGIDLQLLGLGSNGHIGFNEPGSAFDSRTRRVHLDEATRHQNAALFGGDWRAVPATAVTMGIATILEARSILLLVTGAAKAGILSRSLTLEPSTERPASALQHHSDLTLIADRSALAALDFNKLCKAAVPVGGREPHNR
jgi:glucosamine-6-phosphate deaminase